MDLDDDELRATRNFFWKRKAKYIAIPEKELKLMNNEFFKLKKENRELKERIKKMKGER